MTDRPRLVYSSDTGEVCPHCGWPVTRCVCSSTRATASAPAKVVAKLRMEKSGRGGKVVTVIDGLPNNADFLKKLATELKQLCGTGGAVRDGAIELQGDRRERVRPYLVAKGFTVKG